MSHPPSPARVRLAAVLRGLREGAGMSTYALRDVLGWSQTRVTRMENARGDKPPKAADVEAWARATGASEVVRDELAALLKAAGSESMSWHVAHRGGLAARQREMAALERSAAEIAHFQPEAIPGLLQSESYARRILAFADVTNKGGIDAAVRERMKRQAILREPGRRFEYVLTEGALCWRPGPQSLMAEQFGKLAAAASLNDVTFSVIPYDREARNAYIQAFQIFRTPEGPAVITEGYAREDFLADPREVEVFEHIFAILRESALTGEDALDFARTVMLG
jgi:transcriptional regulator with XRE-family HTH domain